MEDAQMDDDGIYITFTGVKQRREKKSSKILIPWKASCEGSPAEILRK